MNSQLLLLINFLVVTALVMYFLSARSKGKQGPILDLRNTPDAEKAAEKDLKAGAEAMAGSQASRKFETKFNLRPDAEASLKTAQESPEVLEVTAEPVKVNPAKVELQEPVSKKEIVYFVYNGHEWEAHEVLGLESGVSLHEATQHYQNLIKTSDPSTFEFYDAAFAAILKLKRNKW